MMILGWLYFNKSTRQLFLMIFTCNCFRKRFLPRVHFDQLDAGEKLFHQGDALVGDDNRSSSAVS